MNTLPQPRETWIMRLRNRVVPVVIWKKLNDSYNVFIIYEDTSEEYSRYLYNKFHDLPSLLDGFELVDVPVTGFNKESFPIICASMTVTQHSFIKRIGKISDFDNRRLSYFARKEKKMKSTFPDMFETYPLLSECNLPF